MSIRGGRDYTNFGGTGMRTAGTTAVEESIRAKARRNLAVDALDQPDPEDWLRDIIDALGLMPTRDHAPGCCRACGEELVLFMPHDVADRQSRNRGLCTPCGRRVAP